MPITAAAYAALHKRAKAVMPLQDLEPSRYWVAVLHEACVLSNVTEHMDFLWVKGKAKSTIEDIHQVYCRDVHRRLYCKEVLRRLYKDKMPSASDFRLQLGPTLPKSTDTMAQLNSEGDRLVVLVLVRPSAPAVSSVPVQETTTPDNSPPPVVKPVPVASCAMASHGTQRLPPPGRSSPSQPPHLSSQLSASLDISTLLTTTQQQQKMHISPYINDPRIMNAIHAEQCRQYPWLNHHVTQSPPGASSPAGGHSGANPHISGVPPRSGASAMALPRPQVSTLNHSVPPSPSSNRPVLEEQHVEPQNPFLQQLPSMTDLGKLEKGAEKGEELLNRLQASLHSDKTESRDAAQWLRSIEDIKRGAVRSRTVIGVVGNTGAGKSSVINALLEEERLVPTNCMRACTAVVTELSYNYSNDGQSQYVADVEFIRAEDWHEELEKLFNELLDGSGNISKEAINPDSDAGIAYAKIRAVYPNKTRDQIATGGLEALLHDAAVNRILGTVEHLADSDSFKFYQQLQTYIDSQEKATGRLKKDEIRRMEYWPLIKVVRVYTKADALSTGAVLVDLPGVQDSNVARAAVADGYMKQCAGYWIVAPIARAVDDKTAKTLLGDSFKGQLKRDGTYGNVTFICSKTDDISIQETVQSLDLNETAEKSWQELDKMKNELQDLKERLKQCKKSKNALSNTIDEFDKELEVDDDLAAGKTVYAPSRKKRKRSSAKSRSQKKRRTEDFDDDFIDDGSEASESSASEPETEDEEEDREPLTSKNIEAKKQEIRDFEQQMEDLREQKDELKKKIAAIDHEINARCIKGRNDHSREAIQQDFANGIKELDQATALEEDEEHFDPDQDLHDYDEVARSLPVFCISSRAFQKLSGRLKRDKDVPGFKHVHETEMPQLQVHCKKLTEAGRAASSRKFLSDLSQLLNSMALWASNGFDGFRLTAARRKKPIEFLKGNLDKLNEDLTEAVRHTISSCTKHLRTRIYVKHDRVVKAAEDACVPKAEAWGKSRNEGGLHFSTYRATVIRNGQYTGTSGSHDFNQELTQPMLDQITPSWSQAFEQELTKELDNFHTLAFKAIRDFYNLVTKTANDSGVSMDITAVLGGQLANYRELLPARVRTVKDVMTTLKREVHREFKTRVIAAMKPAYELCSAERGVGCYKSMKGHMSAHVSRNRTIMFEDSWKAVCDCLHEMLQSIDSELTGLVDGIVSTAERDSLAVFGNPGAGGPASTAEVYLKSDIASILERGKIVFRRLVEGIDDEDQDKDFDYDEHSGVEDAENDCQNQRSEQSEDNEETDTSPTAQMSEPEETVHGMPSDASEASRQWGTEDALIGSGSDKENPPMSGNVGSQVNSNIVPAEVPVLQSVNANM